MSLLLQPAKDELEFKLSCLSKQQQAEVIRQLEAAMLRVLDDANLHLHSPLCDPENFHTNAYATLDAQGGCAFRNKDDDYMEGASHLTGGVLSMIRGE